MGDTHEQRAEQLLKVITNDASVASKHSVTLLILGTFIAITIASTTDEMLIRTSLVTLPLLNVQVPIGSTMSSFYIIAPLMLLVLHLDVLLQLTLVGRRIQFFQEAATHLPDEQRGRLCEQLPSIYFIQFLEGKTPERPLRQASFLISGLTMALPLVLLLWIQGRFLPLHDPTITTFHMLTVVGDAILILLFYRHLPGCHHRSSAPAVWWRRLLQSFGLVSGVCIAIVCVSLFFGFGIYGLTTEAALPEPQAASSGWRTLWYKMRDLNLQERVLTMNPLPIEALNALRDGTIAQREEALKQISPQTFLQGRDLRHANFFNAVLPRLDLRGGTRLQSAKLRWAQMQRALLDEASLQGANLEEARAQEGNLHGANMSGANLKKAHLQVAQLRSVNLQCAQASAAQLQGADLSTSWLQGVDLSGADLRGANLQGAKLQGANLADAKLQGADLSGANLQCADVKNVQWEGAVLRGIFAAYANFQQPQGEPAAISLAQKELAEESLPGQSVEVNLTHFDGADPKYCRKEYEENIFTRCAWRKQRPDIFSMAKEHNDQMALTESLVELACSDAYIARGLISQALSEDSGRTKTERHSFAIKLVKKAQESGEMPGKCRGMHLVSQKVKEDLEDFVKRSAK